MLWKSWRNQEKKTLRGFVLISYLTLQKKGFSCLYLFYIGCFYCWDLPNHCAMKASRLLGFLILRVCFLIVHFTYLVRHSYAAVVHFPNGGDGFPTSNLWVPTARRGRRPQQPVFPRKTTANEGQVFCVQVQSLLWCPVPRGDGRESRRRRQT